MESKSKKIIRKKGIVISDRTDKTIVVEVETLKTHPKYRKKYLSTKKYKAHDEGNRYKVGDIVEIVPMKPKSRGKFYKVV